MAQRSNIRIWEAVSLRLVGAAGDKLKTIGAGKNLHRVRGH